MKMYSGRKINLRLQNEKDAELLQKWYMNRDFRIVYDEYSSISIADIRKEIRNSDTVEDPAAGKIYFVAESRTDDKPIGAACIRNIDRQNGNAEIVLGIGDPDKRLSGFGIDLMIVLLDIVFYELGFSKAYYYVNGNNKLGLSSALNFGFREEGKLRRHTSMEGRYVDRWILGIFKKEYERLSIVPRWKARKTEL